MPPNSHRIMHRTRLIPAKLANEPLVAWRRHRMLPRILVTIAAVTFVLNSSDDSAEAATFGRV
ncbi:hypothetical protein [Rhodopirellula europaea]|uniref:hypothetical protein n=1 Tax=Rhodopirellula europaea TaxID=1263866 RepID=UPI003D299E65